MLQFGKNSEGKFVHISRCIKGEVYVCGNCGDELIIVRGSKKQHHLRHKNKGAYRVGCKELDDKVSQESNEVFDQYDDTLYEWFIGTKTKKGDVYVGRTTIGVDEPNTAYNEEIIGREKL